MLLNQVMVLFPPGLFALPGSDCSHLRLLCLSGLINMHMPVYSTALMKNEIYLVFARQQKLRTEGGTHTSQ